MNSQNNNEANTGMAIIIGGAAVLAYFLFALLAFLALILTIAALTAWNKPRTYFGETITPYEARRFIRCGIAGAFLLPIFVVFSSALLQFEVVPEAWSYMFIGGYVLGSVGVAYLDAQAAEEAKKLAPPQITLPKQEPVAAPARASAAWQPPGSEEPIITPPPPRSQSSQSSSPSDQSFRFASWDDEEELRK